MKTKRLWAQILSNVCIAFVMSTFLGLSAALPAGAQTNVQPTAIPDQAFKAWTNMHFNIFCDTNICAVRQCRESVGKVEGLLQMHCDRLDTMLEMVQCENKLVPDGTKYRWMRGRVNGKPSGDSKLTPNLQKELGRDDKALRCDLGDNIVVDWFTGDKGLSCNNLGFLYVPPAPVFVAVPIPVQPIGFVENPKTWFSNPVNSDSLQYLDSLNLKSCGGSLYLPSQLIETGGTIESSGYSEMMMN